MLNRRQFLRNAAAAASGATATILVTQLGCGSMNDTNVGTSATATLPCDGAGAESSFSDGHTHAICVPASDINAPPAAGAAYTTTLVSGHTHNLDLSQTQLQALGAGQAVTMTTSISLQHTHVFVLQRAAANAMPTPATTPTVGPR